MVTYLRLQVQQTLCGTDQTYTSIGDCFHKIIKEEGVGGLFRGLVPRLVRF